MTFKKGNQLRKGLKPANAFLKGHKPWNKKYPDYFICEECNGKIENKTGHKRRFCDIICYSKYKKRIKYNLPPIHVGEDSFFWRGGISFIKYPREFNNMVKEEIRRKFNYTCQGCFRNQEILGYKLHIHHIDFNKKNNDEDNLIPLCRVCHAGLKARIEESIIVFTNKILQFNKNEI